MLEFLETKLFWITAAAVAIYLYFKCYVLNYWQRHGVPCEPPSILLGNFPFAHFLGKISLGNLIKKNYEKFSEHPFHGFYTFHKPAIVINDPELLKIILVKEFPRFHDRGWFSNDKIDPLAANLFILPGDRWKKLRAKLSPVFTNRNLKQMYPLFAEVSASLLDTCQTELKQSDVLEMKDIIGRYTTDIISSVVYGLKTSSLKNPKDEFHYHGKIVFRNYKLSTLIGIFTPDFLEKLNLPLTKYCTRKFFINTFKDMVNYRRKEKISREDLLNLLMQLTDNGQEDDEGKINNLEKFSMTQAAAQAFLFFLVGYETASSVVTHTLLELALNPEIQDKLRKEIDQMADTTGFTYDSVMNNEFLEMVLTETLRKHPALPLLNRICTEDFLIPNSNYTIPKGMRVIIPTSGIHRNPKFYPDPEKFDPMRFSKENADERTNYVHLGFGEGPRFCIGKRFGQLQSKQAIVTMLQNYTFYVSEKTQIPAKYSTETLVQTPESGVYLRLEQRHF